MWVKFSGPAFQGVDNRLMSLQLIEKELTDSTMFTADGEVVQPSEVLYQKPVMIERGSFRPITNVTIGMLAEAQKAVPRQPGHRRGRARTGLRNDAEEPAFRQEDRPQGFSGSHRRDGRSRQVRDDLQFYPFRPCHCRNACAGTPAIG